MGQAKASRIRVIGASFPPEKLVEAPAGRGPAADYSRELAVLHARSDSLNVLIDAGPLACIPPAVSAGGGHS
jgi:hypothetical protein